MSRQFRNLKHRLTIFYRWAKQAANTWINSHGKHTMLHGMEFAYNASNILIILTTLAALGLVIYDFGFYPFYSHNKLLYTFLTYALNAFKVLYLIRFITEWVEIKKAKAHFYNFLLVIFIFYLGWVCSRIIELEEVASRLYIIRKSILYGGVAFLFLAEVSGLLKFIYSKRQNPSFVFIVSFAVIITIGMLLLMLPNATTHGISPVDALFTSASAVCVTGLTVIDTAYDFTMTGKVIIMFLIQIGGLGIMTFTGLLAYLASGSVSIHGQLALKSMVSSNRISNVITIVTRIIIVTLFFEGLGAFFIYLTIDKNLFADNIDRLFFSVFHAVSGFCNAGFSTESAGLYSETLRFNYPLHMIIALLVILGGMGFPIVFNIFTYLRIKTYRFVEKLYYKEKHREAITRILQVNSKLALATTVILIITGFAAYLLLEQNGTLKDHHTITGKLVTSFFGSVTPRTAGFNTVDMAKLTLPMIMFYLLLMWIGASPSSTGGGIKTTTIAVAFLNLKSIMKERRRTDVFRTQISEHSINKAFAVILLSLLIIGLTVTLIAINDSDKGLLKIAFESFSAFSTVGLTLGITPQLSDLSKVILVLTMFIGRVGALTILMAFVSQARPQAYRYPEEEIQY